MVGSNMVMYEPNFDKSRSKKVQESLTGMAGLSVPIKGLFFDNTNSHYFQSNSRNGDVQRHMTTTDFHQPGVIHQS